MLTRYIIAFAFTATVSAGIFGKLWLDARDKAKAQWIRAEQLDGQVSAMHERAERAAAARAEGEQLRVEVRNATGDWGRDTVPAGVTDRLCARAACASASGLSSSGD